MSATGEGDDGKTRTVQCKNQGCARTVQVPAPPLPSEGHPYGWLYLTVHVPAWFNSASGRPYRAIGLFCSADCLGAYIGELRREEERHRHAYEHE